MFMMTTTRVDWQIDGIALESIIAKNVNKNFVLFQFG